MNPKRCGPPLSIIHGQYKAGAAGGVISNQDAEVAAIVKAVKDFARSRHSLLTRSDMSRWNLSEEEYAKLQWSKQGYVLITVEDVNIAEVQIEDGVKVWYVAATIHTGLSDCKPDIYSCCKGVSGQYSIEWTYS